MTTPEYTPKKYPVVDDGPEPRTLGRIIREDVAKLHDGIPASGVVGDEFWLKENPTEEVPLHSAQGHVGIEAVTHVAELQQPEGEK